MGAPHTRKKILLTQTNVSATDVQVSITCETVAGARVDFLSCRKDPASGTRVLKCEIRNSDARIGLLAPLDGVNLSAAGVIALVPATNINPQGSQEPLAVDVRTPIRNDVFLKGGDGILLKAEALAQNETLTVFLRAQDAPLVITNSSGEGVTMTVTDA